MTVRNRFLILACLSLLGCENSLLDQVLEVRTLEESPRLEVIGPNQNTLTEGGLVNFPDSLITGSTTVNLTLSNTGHQSLVVNPADVLLTLGQGVESGTITLDGPPVLTLPEGAHATFTLHFAPASAGAKAATLRIASNDRARPTFTVTLQGKGLYVPVPVLTTTAASSITTTSALAGGDVTSDEGDSVTERGLCWGTSPQPTIGGPKVTNAGLGTGSFTDSLGPLSPGQFYYVRAYATNSHGTGYGQQISFFTVPPAPAAPTATAVDGLGGNGKLRVNWTAVAGANLYEVYCYTADSFASAVQMPGGIDLPASTTSCELSGLASYQNYYVWVRAKNASGISGWSPTSASAISGVKVASIVLSKTPVALLIGTPESLVATCYPVTANQRTVHWTTSNAGLATVSAGTVTPLVAGAVTITATADDGQGAATAFTATSKVFAANTVGPAGGFLFYDSGSYGTKGWRYLEAAPVNTAGGLSWRNGLNLVIAGAFGTDFGAGKANTDAIIAAQGAGTYMAEQCRNYTLNGYNDWFMPSQIEANQMLYAVTSINYPSLWGFASSSQLDNGSGNGCWAFHQASTSPFAWGWYQTLTSWATSGYLTRPARQF